MSRTRMIKPSFFKHAELYEAERASGLPLRIAFAGLWTVADREGRFKWKPDLKPDVLPYDPVDMTAVLSALEEHGFVQSYVVAGKTYGLIPSFSDHQTFHKTERHSTLPAPCSNGESTVRYTADTVTASVTGTGTVTELIAAADSDSAIQQALADSLGVREPELTALFLSICANKAVTERWGEQINPYTQGNAAALLDALRAAGVPPEIARLSLYRQCRESKQKNPPRSINYFRPGIIEDWEAEQARRAVAASGEAPPVPPSGAGARGAVARGARRGNQPDTGRATVLLGQIKALIRESRQPGQGTHRFIPKADVAALGGDVLAAYESVGGAERVITADGDKMSFLIRDFTAALDAQEAAHV